jgi:hypothetical protein
MEMGRKRQFKTTDYADATDGQDFCRTCLRRERRGWRAHLTVILTYLPESV